MPGHLAEHAEAMDFASGSWEVSPAGRANPNESTGNVTYRTSECAFDFPRAVYQQ
jgi:hypothetical protein